MNDEIEQIELELRDIRQHLAVWPNDKHGLQKLAFCEEALLVAKRDAVPLMSHMRTRPAMSAPAPLPNPCSICDQHIPCSKCVHASTAEILKRYEASKAVDWSKVKNPMDPEDVRRADDRNRERHIVTPDIQEMHARTRKAINQPRYTFGEDPDMDERWLEAEREKSIGLHPKQWSGKQPYESIEQSRPERDMFLFQTSAFNLTGIHNVRYGKLG